MAGADAQAGFVYQNDYAAFRLLGSEAKRILLPADRGDCIHSFAIEGRQTVDGEAWDVSWTLESGQISLRECKDTAITKDDRGIFYRRARREIAAGCEPDRLEIGWVTDPGKQGDVLEHFEGMKGIALLDQESGLGVPDRVNSAKSALAEALYWLCSEEVFGPPLQIADARRLLSNLAIERFGDSKLSELVQRLAPTLFSAGAGSALRNLVHGTLATTIQRNGEASFTTKDFLCGLGTDRLTLEMEQSLRDIITFSSAVAAPDVISGITWERFPTSANRIWSITERLGAEFPKKSCVLAARTGVGKTTCTQQLLEETAGRLNKHHVLRIEVSNAGPETVRVLPRLCGLLCGVSPSWIAIDGIDQIGPETRGDWPQTLKRLLRIPNLTVVVTARKEVIAAHDWMLELLSTLPEVFLAELPRTAIEAEFTRVGIASPRNLALVECLRNPFLFSLYAKIAAPDDFPLSRGEVTGFDVIDAYWKRRVMPASQGYRAVGDPALSGTPKRKAAKYLAEQTLLGAVAIQLSTDPLIANGIENLLREGIVIAHSTSAVVWSHSWLREFATIDCLVGTIAEPSSLSVAIAVAEVKVDHSSRIAAVGGCKWLCSHSAQGSVEAYLSKLYELKTSLAREALTVLIEDSPRHLDLSELPPPLLLEALVFARQMRARQWLGQVTQLPDSIFTGELGDKLQLAALEYEKEMVAYE